jgi:hypothetical protein
MAELPLDQAVPRFKENEDRLDTFVNSATGYTTSGGVSVQSIQQFLASIGSNGIDFVDNAKARFGTGNDLEIYHSGTESYIDEKGTGSLRIRSAGSIVIEGIDGTNSILADTDAEVQLYHNGSKKLETTSTGIDVFGTVEFNGLSGTGAVTITDIADEDNMASNSATKLATQQSIKAYVDAQVGTADTLSEVLGLGNTTGGTDIAVSANDDITFTDSSKAIFGAGSDLQIYHDASNSYIKDVGTGNLFIDATSLRLRTGNGSEIYLRADANGSVALYNNNVKKLETTSTGIDVTGNLTVASANPEIFLTDTDTGVDHSIDADSSTGTLNFNVDKNDEGSAPTFRLNVGGGTDVLVARENAQVNFSGRIAIGTSTTTADHELHIESNSPTIRLEDTGGNQKFDITHNFVTTTFDYETNMLFKRSDGTERVRFDADGVDITGTLDVSSDIGIGRVAGAYTFTETIGGDERAGIHSNASNELIFKTGVASERMKLTSTGIDVIGTVEFDGLSGTGAVTVTDILDEDDMTSDSATALATQQSIKAYVDANAGGGSGGLPTTGGTMTGNLRFNDGIRAQFGNSNDLQIWHNGTDSYVYDTGEGDLILRGSSNIKLQSSSGTALSTFTAAGASTLYYSAAEKLATTSTGVDVTGIVEITSNTDISMDASASGQLYINGSGYGFGIALDADAANIYTNSASRDLVFGVNETEVARVKPTGIDVTGNVNSTASLTFGSGGAYEAGSIYSDANWGMIHRAYTANPVQADHLFVNSAGTERMRIYDAGIDVSGVIRCVVTSAPAWDTNTRFWGESGFGARYDSYQHRWDVGLTRTEAMRIDSSGKVGIGDTTPEAPLTVTGTIKSNGSGYFTGNTQWATNASLITSGSYGGGLTMIDGSKAYSFHTLSGGEVFAIVQGATSGAATEKLRIDQTKLKVSGNLETTGNIDISGAGTRRIDISNTTLADTGEMATLQWDNNANLTIQGRTSAGGFAANWYSIQTSDTDGRADAHIFYTDASTERMRVNSSGINVTGDLTVSSTIEVGSLTPNQDGAIEVGVIALGTPAISSTTDATGLRNHIIFDNPNGVVGKINTLNSSTTYLTSSDYRLKTDVQEMTGSIDRVKALRPVNFEWVVDGTRVDGFLAHEAQEIVPEAVDGEKDAMRDQQYVESVATGDIYTPAVKATYETIQVELTPAVGAVYETVTVEITPAVDAVYKTVTVEISPAVEATYDDEGNELTPAVEAITEEQEQLVTPAIEAVTEEQEQLVTPAVDATYEEQQQELTPAIDEVIHSSDVVEPDELEEGQLWRETTEKVMATRQVPDYQGIDQSKIVPLLTSALQDAIAKIEALETRLEALEA